MMKNFLLVLIAVLFVFVLNDSFAQSSDGSQDSKNQYVPPTSQNEQEKPYAPPASSGETKPPYTPPEESKFPISVNPQIQESEPVEQIQESEPVEQIQESEPVEQIQESEPLQIDPVYTPEPVYVPEPISESVVEPVVEQVVNCGPGTESVNGVCQVVQTITQESEEGGGCLIATAAYGSEMSPQVQLLREIRDNQLMNTESGTAFMSGFNELYYSFSPTIADMEREHPMFKEIVKVGLTPMISSLAIMENANSESDVIGLGLSVIMLNLGIYLGVPAVVIVGIRKRI
jgi:hypothetical protein